MELIIAELAYMRHSITTITPFFEHMQRLKVLAIES